MTDRTESDRTKAARTLGSLRAADGKAVVQDLAAHLAGRASADWRTRWTELIPAYIEQERRLG